MKLLLISVIQNALKYSCFDFQKKYLKKNGLKWFQIYFMNSSLLQRMQKSPGEGSHFRYIGASMREQNNVWNGVFFPQWNTKSRECI